MERCYSAANSTRPFQAQITSHHSFRTEISNSPRLQLPVSLEKPPKNTHSHDPHGLLGGSGILGTLPLTETCVTAFTSGFGVVTDAGSGVDSDGLFDDLESTFRID